MQKLCRVCRIRLRGVTCFEIKVLDFSSLDFLDRGGFIYVSFCRARCWQILLEQQAIQGWKCFSACFFRMSLMFFTYICVLCRRFRFSKNLRGRGSWVWLFIVIFFMYVCIYMYMRSNLVKFLELVQQVRGGSNVQVGGIWVSVFGRGCTLRFFQEKFRIEQFFKFGIIG